MRTWTGLKERIDFRSRSVSHTWRNQDRHIHEKAQQAAKEELAKAIPSALYGTRLKKFFLLSWENLKAQQAVVDAKKKVLDDLQEERPSSQVALSADVTI